MKYVYLIWFGGPAPTFVGTHRNQIISTKSLDLILGYRYHALEPDFHC